MILTSTAQNIVYTVVIDDLAGFLVNLGMLLVTFVSASCAFLAYFHQKNRSKKDAACKLAEHYANVILDEHSFISNVYRMTGLDSYIKNVIDINSMHDFDKVELHGILKDKEYNADEFMRKIHDIDPSIIMQCRMLRCRTTEERHSVLSGFTFKDPETGENKIQNGAYLRLDLQQDISDLLNRLEYFSMNCRYGLADEEILYQSLHQTFISLVWILYPTISNRNVSNEDKLYTNVIWLFTKWRERLTEIKEKAEMEKALMEEKANEAQRQAELAQEKADQAKEKADAIKAKVFSGKGLK